MTKPASSIGSQLDPETLNGIVQQSPRTIEAAHLQVMTSSSAPIPTTAAATFCATIVDEWVRGGVIRAFVAPGSRSTPLAIALLADDRMTVDVFHDERGASFAALGWGLATGVPAIALCTSGTAAAHFHPAVIEADLSSVPLIVCTADRPPELWDIGAPQTIDQTKLYGDSARFYAEPGVPDEATSPAWRPLAARTVLEASGWSGRPGPVHLNLSFRDPLVGLPADLPPGRADDRPWHGTTSSNANPTSGSNVPQVNDLAAVLLTPTGECANGVVIAGAGTPDPEMVLELADHLGWPVLADHRSGCRAGPNAITHFDSLLRSAPFADSVEPDVVIRFGEVLASKVLSQWLSTSTATIVAVTAGTRWSDPEGVTSDVIHGPGVAASLLDGLPDRASRSRSIDRWIEADALASKLTDEHLTAGGSEIEIARAVVDAVPEGGALVVASSMPVRDVEWFGAPRNDITVFANRGANGIDGTIATAIGVALTGRSTTVLVGDVALLHDSPSLVALAERSADLHIVVVDNDGGGIFSFLPQAELLETETFETLFGTPHRTDLAALAAAHHLPDVAWPDRHAPSVTGPRLTIGTTDREANVELHRQISQAIGTALTDVATSW